MRAPVRFVLLRHLLTHPDEDATAITKHTGAQYHSLREALKRLDREGLRHPEQLFAELQRTSEKPPRSECSFQLPNPENWRAQYGGPFWLSGELAAERDGFDLVPERHLVYVKPENREAALRAAFDAYGKLAPSSKANLTVRVADPWLFLEGELVERGQRLLDYFESKHVQLARGLRSLA